VFPTSVFGNLCGFYALARSLSAARALFRAPDGVIRNEIAWQTMRDWIRNQHPLCTVAIAAYRAQIVDEIGGANVDDLVQDMNDDENIDVTGIHLILWGTRYNL